MTYATKAELAKLVNEEIQKKNLGYKPVTRNSIRFLDVLGLIKPFTVSKTGYRYFDTDKTIERILKIKKIQKEERLSLREIAKRFKGK
jgi:DNA-binding transcriptional MerR regulator